VVVEGEHCCGGGGGAAVRLGLECGLGGGLVTEEME
jgi:hypothetical protein